MKTVALFIESGDQEFFPKIETWIRETILREPEELRLYLTLARLLGARGKWKDALDTLHPFLLSLDSLENTVGEATDFFISAAAAGYAKEALETLWETPGASLLEPLVAGLRIYLGKKVSVAQEILEVGRDVAKRIEET